jgi:hypothetical protein
MQPGQRQQAGAAPGIDPEWEEELIATIEEQDFALRSVALGCCTPQTPLNACAAAGL